ncbi:hypothetical protein THMIRHAM_09980 [Thiomicrorhabdus immobilis]|uniref:Response regulatory domain-containing protein n=1 Tax=Thiomicrorhabdus immobilis TaxID=2791037 RepID=A0ABN6CW96_9GAMM|nr:fused response regulator/phosphatase [Thiomicrorhabdus immobilis]BCN93213.1 hypothetical protein THMIRHAM_09980 [Thiomicrorhabdus immobilis]
MPVSQISQFGKPYILAVDDEQMNRYILEDIIEDRYQLKTVESGEACLEVVKENVPDLILLDINMPGISGYEVCKRLKENPLTSHIPVIFLTAMVKVDDEKNGLQMGAVDYISKPFTESILLARINTHLELSFTRKKLEHNHKLLKQERDYIEKIIDCMHSDKRYDSSCLKVMASPVDVSNGDIVLSACNQKHHQHILFGDFTGHGIHAAIAGPLVSSLFYTLVEQNHSAEFILSLINDELFRKLPTQHFLAATYIDWNKEQGQVTIWNFGSPDAIFYDQQQFQFVPSMSLALGILEFNQHSLEPLSFSIKTDDKLYVFSDGITEVVNPQGEEFGFDKVLAVIQEMNQQGLGVDTILKKIERFSEGKPLKDDATLLELKFRV